MIFPNKEHIKVVVITDFGQRQTFALNAENITDLPQTLQMLSLCCFSYSEPQNAGLVDVEKDLH